MKYIMDDREKILYALVQDQGVNETIQQIIRATIELAHTYSDLGLKERAQKLMAASDVLKETQDKIED